MTQNTEPGLKKRSKIILILISLSIASIALLYLFSYDQNNLLNGFSRKVITEYFPSQILDVKYNSYYIAGLTDNRIYLGNTTAAQLLLVISRSQLSMYFEKINKVSELNLSGSHVVIDSPYLYLSDQSNYGLFSGQLDPISIEPFERKRDLFSEAIPLHPGAFIVREFTKNKPEYTLTKETSYPPYRINRQNTLQKQIDGMYCTDGMLLYDNKSKLVIYVYYYRNQFICMDTNLNVLRRNQTIDTNTTAKIKVANITSNRSIVLASPPAIVNKNCSAFHSYLFVQSNLRADNENNLKFQSTSVIDKYNIFSGKYVGSYYLSNPMKEKLKAFAVSRNCIAGLYSHYLIIYKPGKALLEP